jgi:hypothetical protein
MDFPQSSRAAIMNEARRDRRIDRLVFVAYMVDNKSILLSDQTAIVAPF